MRCPHHSRVLCGRRGPLQKGFLRQLLKDKPLVESIRRVVENWKTALKVKGPLLLNSLLKIYPNLKKEMPDPLDEDKEDEEPTCPYVQRLVRTYACISFVHCLF